MKWPHSDHQACEKKDLGTAFPRKRIIVGNYYTLIESRKEKLPISKILLKHEF